jgi:D,D-heptose 1,7-bisphosphate phosphatase
VQAYVEREARGGYDQPSVYREFGGAINRVKGELRDLLGKLHREGKRIAGYGASHSVTTMLHHFDVAGYIEFIVDDNTRKHGTYSPGHHIPVKPASAIYEQRPDYVVILPWRFAEMIIGKHGRYLEDGGHFITYLPQVSNQVTGMHAVFLDRDGVIIRDVHLLTEPSQVELLEGTADALKVLQQTGFLLVVVSNQPVVARGLATEAQVRAVNSYLADRLAAMGVRLAAFYFCPHHPKANVSEYRRDCECRKPRPGMLLLAQRELAIDSSGSYMVGDRLSDVAAGQLAGCTTILIDRGKESWKRIESPAWASFPTPYPDYRCRGLQEAAEYILLA